MDLMPNPQLERIKNLSSEPVFYPSTVTVKDEMKEDWQRPYKALHPIFLQPESIGYVCMQPKH
jgi:hypothetical protein